MALVVCAECGKPVSDKATACPNCGNPIGGASPPSPNAPRLIEKTKKEWKVIRLISAILAFFSIIILLSGFGAHNKEAIGFGGMLFLFALAGSLVGRIGAWWSTG